jgi:Ca2+:H+ antiporter
MQRQATVPARSLASLFSLNWLLIGVPLALLGKALGWGDLAIFMLSALAIVPLAGLIGDATEIVAERTGPQIGGLLNATLGNAAELIITVLALEAGYVELVRASLIGSILGNLLLVTGMSILVGGLRHGTQTFDRRTASGNGTLIILSFLALAIPSVFDPGLFGTGPAEGSRRELFFSIGIAGVMIALYLSSVLFSLKNPIADLQTREIAEEKTIPDTHTLRTAILLLIGSTIAIAVMSELLVGSVETVINQLNLSEFFVGIIVIPLIGNVAEHVVAVRFAGENRMNLSLGISLGSSLQIALFVMPVLVFVSLLFPTHLLLVFNRYDLLALATAAIATMLVSQDGESNWLEGAQLLAVYVILGLAFYVLPSVK